MISPNCIRPSLLIAVAGLNVAPAWSQDAPQVDLGTLVLDFFGTVGATETMTDEDITNQQPMSLNELFARSPEVFVSGANRTAAQKVYVRGLEELYLNVTIDGAKQAGNLFAHSGNNTGLDFGILKRVDVSAGTGNALAGAGALGGTIRYETKDPEDLLLEGQIHGAMMRFGAQSNGERASLGLGAYGVPDNRFAYFIYGSTSSAQNFEDGAGREVSDTDNEPDYGLIKLRYRPTEDHEFEFTSDYNADNGDRYLRSNFGVNPSLPFAAPEDQELTRNATTLRYSYSSENNPLIDFQALAFSNTSRLKRNIAVALESEWETQGIDLRNRSELGTLMLTYGYDYTWDRSTGRSQAGINAHETAETHGLYVQADYDISQKISVSGGFRYDRAKLTDLNDNKYDNDHISPNLSLAYEPVVGFKLSASFAEAFRGLRPVEGLTLIRPQGLDAATDLSLSGQVSRTVDLGFDYDRDGWSAGARAFSTKIHDAVQFWQGDLNPFSRINRGTVKLTGLTASVGRQINNWTVGLSYSKTDVSLNGLPTTPDDWLDNVSPQGDKINLNIGFNLPQKNLRMNWNSTFIMAEKDLTETFKNRHGLNELPAYDVHDFSLIWTPTEAQEYSIGVTNIFDKNYLDHSTPYSIPGGATTLYEPGRSIRIAANIRF